MSVHSLRRWQFKHLITRENPTPLIVLADRNLTFITNRVKQIVAVDLHIPNRNRIILKLEHLAETSPTGSLYDRLYAWLFLRAEEAGYIKPGESPVIEASVGNAGAAFARTACFLGYKKPIVILPEDIYPARIQQIKDLGADLIFSPAKIGPIGYVNLLEEIIREDWKRKGKLGRDFSRLYPISKIRKIPNEPYAMLVNETLCQLTSACISDKVDTFVFGVGSGNAISQIGIALKKKYPKVNVIVCEHTERPFVKRLLNGEEIKVGGEWPEPDYPATTIHGVPLKKLSLDLSVIDGTILVPRSERDEGWYIVNDILKLCAGRPTGGVLAAALRIAERVENQNIFTVVFDHVGKYGLEYEYVSIWTKDLFSSKSILKAVC